jgi:hypothetical protein
VKLLLFIRSLGLALSILGGVPWFIGIPGDLFPGSQRASHPLLLFSKDKLELERMRKIFVPKSTRPDLGF